MFQNKKPRTKLIVGVEVARTPSKRLKPTNQSGCILRECCTQLSHPHCHDSQ